MHMVTAKLRKVAGSVIISIPADLLREAGMSEGDTVLIMAQKDTLHVIPSAVVEKYLCDLR